MKLHSPRRYQLNKAAIQPLKSGHPWIFRNHLSSAIEPFPNGQWLALVDDKNKTLGYGILEKTDGLIGIRVLKQGETPPSIDWLRERIGKAIHARRNLRKYSDAFRAIHGENDGLPGIVVDVYGKTAVLQTYAPSVDLLGRYVATRVAGELDLENIVWKLPAKRKHQEGQEPIRILKGHPPRKIAFREGKLTLTVEPLEGQKSGAFLDLRALRKWISLKELKGGKVLNLFSYTGTLGLAAETGGASEVLNIDISKGALETAQSFHQLKKGKQKYIAADIFEWIRDAARKKEMGRYSLAIVDPPMMASRSEQVPRVLRKYEELYDAVAPLVAKGGYLVAACCTSRVKREIFNKTVGSTLGNEFRLVQSLSPEEDHPVSFTEGDYLKILIFQKR